MAPVHTIIWDWNGTLLDDQWLAMEVANGMLERRGLPPVTASDYRNVFGFPVETYYRSVGFDLEREPFPVLADEFIREFDRRLPECRLHDGARELLTAVQEQGSTQIILSASRRESLLRAVDHHGITQYFTAVYGLDDHFAVSKRGLARAVAARLPGSRTTAMVVGDTIHDAEVARDIDVPCALVARGHQSADRLRTVGVPVFRDLHELAACLRAADRCAGTVAGVSTHGTPTQ